jgi:hypothetical protein
MFETTVIEQMRRSHSSSTHPSSSAHADAYLQIPRATALVSNPGAWIILV